LETCKGIKQGALLCGHIHRTYQVGLEGLTADLFCAGSATMEGHEGFWVYEVDHKQIESKRVYWNKTEYCFADNR